MNKEEKEQWLYEAYQYTSNFDFNRLDKYEEANDDICIDDLILDYTMLYEFHKEEIEKQDQEIKRLNNIINELEKWLDKKEKLTFNSWNKGIHEVQRKLQELKGDDKNGKS